MPVYLNPLMIENFLYNTATVVVSHLSRSIWLKCQLFWKAIVILKNRIRHSSILTLSLLSMSQKLNQVNCRWENIITILPAHACVLQASVSVSGPSPCCAQLRPPCWGMGFVHERVRVCCPPLHNRVHAPHDDHRVKPPSTMIMPWDKY